MPNSIPEARFPGLTVERRGSTWRVVHKDDSWPVILYARNVYHGTARLNVTLTFDRHDPGMKSSVRLLVGAVDLLVHAQCERFAKSAAERLLRAQGDDEAKAKVWQTSFETMISAIRERLLESAGEVTMVDIATVDVPSDLTPRYAVWPLVPMMRAGMFVAPSGTGKSTIAAGVGLGVSHDIQLIPGIENRVSGPVVYIGQEEDAEQMRVRVEMLARGHQFKVRKDRFHFMKLRGASLIESAEKIAEDAAGVHAVLIIIDSAQATWGAGDDALREYASKWFNAVEGLGVPSLVIEHPNLAGTKRGTGPLEAAGTSVKRDRAGHVWSVRSQELPVKPGMPFRYHVTMMDTKRNYVARQPDITFETLIDSSNFSKFVPADALTADTVVDSSKNGDLLAAVMRGDTEHEDGWTVVELQQRLKFRDDRRLRDELKHEVWRHANWNAGLEYRFEQVDGSGDSRTNPSRFQLATRPSQVEISVAPGQGTGDTDLQLN